MVKGKDGVHSSNLGTCARLVTSRLLCDGQNAGCPGPGGLRTELHLKGGAATKTPPPPAGVLGFRPCWGSAILSRV